MATGTVRSLITASLKRLGAISGIETPSADLAQDGLARFNELAETWATESLTLWTQGALRAVLLGSPPITGYTIGPGGDIETAIRPAWVDSASWVLPGTPEMEYKLTPMLKKEWENEQFKLLQSAQSTHYYYEADFPLGQVQLWPRPLTTFSLLLYVPQLLQNAAATLDTVLMLPPGYWRALRDFLAIELAPEVGRGPIDPALAQSAIEAKAQLQRVNFRPRVLGMPIEIATGNTAGYDWRVD